VTTVCVAGATGWTGRAVAEAVLAADDLQLVSAVGRRAAGQDLGSAWDIDPVGVRVSALVDDAALDGVDVLVDFTTHEAAQQHALVAIAAGVHVVLGTSGLTAADFAGIDAAARANSVGAVAAGNFSLTAAMAQAAALLVAIRHDAGPTPAPYVAGTLLAVRTVPRLVGLVRGLDTLLLGRLD